jgi:serine/threonine protein kinase
VANDDSAFSLSGDLMVNDRYAIVEPISRGAMGAVYVARDIETDTLVALKHLTDNRHSARFEVEARLLALLRHPRVVRIIDYFHDDSGQYLLMDLVRGTDLYILLRQRGNPGLPLDEAIRYTREACEALQYVHEQQIVHRDVKPQNLILGGEGVVLVDFGVARLMEDEEPGTVGIGTPRYMAPEVFAGGSVSPRSDVFGVAATLWTLIAGKPPVYAGTTNLSSINPDVTPELERAVAAGLELIPERRIASVRAFANAIGPPLSRSRGESLALSIEQPAAPRSLMEAVVRTAAGVFDAAAVSIAFIDETTRELVYQSAWGAGASEIVGVRLPPGTGIAGNVAETGEAQAVPNCRNDPRFAARIAAGTGYVPYTMLVVPLLRHGEPIGALSLLDRRDGGLYGPGDLDRAQLFAELAVTALNVNPSLFTSLGLTVTSYGRPRDT